MNWIRAAHYISFLALAISVTITASTSRPPESSTHMASTQSAKQAITRFTDGPVYSSAVFGKYLYSGSGGAIRVFHNPSKTDKPNWRQINMVSTPGIIRDLKIDHNTLYIADDHGALRLYDISKPKKPIALGSVKLEKLVRAVSIHGHYAYLATGWNGVAIVDIKDKFNPNFITYKNNLGYILDVFATDNFVYAIDSNNGLKILDATVPTQMKIVSEVNIPGFGHGVFVKNNKAYIVTLEKDKHPGSGGLTIIDVTTATAPKQLGSLSLVYGAEGVHVSDDYAYLAGVANDAGLIVVDIKDPKSPKKLGAFKHPTCSESVTLSGNLAYLAHGDRGLEIIDVSNPLSPTVVQHFDANGHTRGIFVEGDRAYIANGYTGLRILDISNQSAPKEIGKIATYRALDVVVRNHIAYVADGWSGIKIIDVKNPNHPIQLSEKKFPSYSESISLLGNYAILANGSAGLRIIDISNPKSPTETGHLDTPGYAYKVTLSENRIFLADGKSGLRIYELKNGKPIELGHYQGGSAYFSVFDVAIQDQYAYLAANSDGVHIVDISNPNRPVKVGQFSVNRQAKSVQVTKNTLYLGTIDGIETLNIINPIQPKRIEQYDTPGHASKIQLNNGTLFIAAREAGLLILHTKKNLN